MGPVLVANTGRAGEKLEGPLFVGRFRGVMVSTLDSESSDPSSNLGGTCSTLFIARVLVAGWKGSKPTADRFYTRPGPAVGRKTWSETVAPPNQT